MTKKHEPAFPGRSKKTIELTDQQPGSLASPEDVAIQRLDIRASFGKMSASRENELRMKLGISEGPNHKLPIQGQRFASTRMTLKQIEARCLKRLAEKTN